MRCRVPEVPAGLGRARTGAPARVGRWAPCSRAETEGGGRAGRADRVLGLAERRGSRTWGLCEARWLWLFSGSVALYCAYAVSAHTTLAWGTGRQPADHRQWIQVDPVKPGTSPPPPNHPSKVGIRSCYPDTFPTLSCRACLHPMHEYHVPDRLHYARASSRLLVLEGPRGHQEPTRRNRATQPPSPVYSVARHEHERRGSEVVAAAAAAAAAKATAIATANTWTDGLAARKH